MVVDVNRGCVDGLEGEWTYAACPKTVERSKSFADVPGDFPTPAGWPQKRLHFGLSPKRSMMISIGDGVRRKGDNPIQARRENENRA